MFNTACRGRRAYLHGDTESLTENFNAYSARHCLCSSARFLSLGEYRDNGGRETTRGFDRLACLDNHDDQSADAAIRCVLIGAGSRRPMEEKRPGKLSGRCFFLRLGRSLAPR